MLVSHTKGKCVITIYIPGFTKMAFSLQKTNAYACTVNKNIIHENDAYFIIQWICFRRSSICYMYEMYSRIVMKVVIA